MTSSTRTVLIIGAVLTGYACQKLPAEALHHDVAVTRDEMRSWAQNEIYDVDSRIDAASLTAEAWAPQTRQQFNAAIARIKRQRDLLNTELAGLEKHVGDKFEGNKALFTQRLDQIKLDLESIEQAN